MKILLIYPVINTTFSYGYGLGYISAVLKDSGHSTSYFILEKKEDIGTLCEKVKKERPAVTVFSATTCQFVYLKEIIPKIKIFSDTYIIAGGIHPTLTPDCLEDIPGLDAIVRGEGEYALSEFVKLYESGSGYLSVKGFRFRTDDRIVDNGISPLIKNLDALPLPDKSSLDYQGVLDRLDGNNRYIFSRGCVYNCPYCSNKAMMDLYRENGRYYRTLSPGRAIQYIEHDASMFDFSRIFFDDDIIYLDKNWFYEFFALYRERFKYPFYCNVRPGSLDRDMIRVLKESGAAGLIIGIEHGNEKFRKEVLRREISNSAIIDVFDMCGELGITDNYGQIIIGLPHETPELYLDTVRLCRRLKISPSSFYAYIFQPYPRTEFGSLCEEYGWIPDKKAFNERNEAVIGFPSFEKQDIQLCFELFFTLVRHRYLPLKLPLLSTGALLKSYGSVSAILSRLKGLF